MVQIKTVAAATLLASAVSAYEVLTPTLNSTVAKGEHVTIDWTSVDTDAEVFSVYLTNFQTHHWPPTVLSLAQNVPREDGSISLRIPCDVSSDYGWQINFINGTNTYVIYAQSPAFSLDGDCVDPEPIPDYVPEPEPTPYETPVYGHATETGSAAPYPTASGHYNTSIPTGTGYHSASGVEYTTATTTSTATLCTSVKKVNYATPVVWFVEPSKEAVCNAGPAKETATVTKTIYADGSEKTSKPTVHAYPTAGHGQYSSADVEVEYPHTTVEYSQNTHAGYAAPTGTGSIKASDYPTYTGAASSVRAGSLFAVVIGAAALLM